MKKVLITGISGFAGGYLAEHLAKKDSYTITGTYHSSKPALFDDAPITLRQIDLTNDSAVFDLISSVAPDIVVHLAAMASPAKSFDEPAKTIMNNVVSQISLLEALRKQQMRETRIIIVSSADVYGLIRPEDVPIDEETPFRPGNPYGVSKLTQDYLGLQYVNAYKLNLIRVRPFNHIGPRQNERFAIASFAKQIAEIEKKKKEPVIRVGNLDAKKDFTDVRDIVRGYELLFDKGEKGEAYNLGSGNAYRIGDLLDKLLGMASQKITIEKDDRLFRPSDTAYLVCDNTKVANATGWKPEIPMEDTLKGILDYWREVV